MKIKMTKRLLSVVCAAAASVTMFSGTGLAASAKIGLSVLSNDTETKGGEAIVMYRGTTAMQSKALSSNIKSNVRISETYTFDTSKDASAQSSAVDNTLKKGFAVSLVHSDTLSTEALIAALEQQAGVVCAEPNVKIHTAAYDSEPLSAYQWALENNGQNGGTPGLDIQADTPELAADPSAGEQVIALVDTGVDYTHPDLKDRIWNNPYTETGALNGQHGYDFINMDDDPMDDNGHGTHCSGIMAASVQNGIGMAGTAAAEQVKIMGLKILDAEGSGYGMEAVGAYNYIYQAQQNGVNVVAVNNSWGGSPEEESHILATLIDLVGANGAVSICAAGNESADNDVTESMPANIDSPYIISVAASNENDELATFSNYGVESVDIAAPGSNILSSVSYPVMNPTFYSDARKTELLHVYQSFSDTQLTAYDNLAAVPEDSASIAYVVDAAGNGSVSVTQDTEHYFGLAEDGAASLRFAVTGAEAGDTYTLYLPYIAQNGENCPYLSAELRTSAPEMEMPEDFLEMLESSISTYSLSASTVDEDGVYAAELEDYLYEDFLTGTNNYWNSVSEELSSQKEGQLCAVSVQINCGTDGDYEILLDEMAISDVNAPQDELLQNYDYYNGTSMATPHVTGAMAALAAANPNKNADERIALLLGCVRKSTALTGMVKTGGVLDLSYLSHPNPVLTDMYLDMENNTLVVQGSQLIDAVVTINGEPATIVASADNELSLDITGMEKQQLEVSVQLGEETYNKNFFYAVGSPADILYSAAEDIAVEQSSLLVYNDSLFYLTPYGAVYQTSIYDSTIWNNLSESFDLGQLVSETEMYDNINCYSTKYVSDGTYFYTVIHLDYGYMQKNVLAAYDPETLEWHSCSTLPPAYAAYTDFAIACDSDSIYLLGGNNTLTDEMTADVLVYDLVEGVWNNGPSLPEPACSGNAQFINGSLILTMQQTESGFHIAPWILDGGNWIVSNAAAPEIAQPDEFSMDACLLASTAADEDMLYYVGMPAIATGDIFTYQPAENTFSECDYSLYNNSDQHIFSAAISDGVMYIVYDTAEGTDTALLALNGSLPIYTDTYKGDVDMDGSVTMTDAYQTLLYSSYMSAGDSDYTFTGEPDSDAEALAVMAADVDEDGTVDMMDAYYILLYSSYLSAGGSPEWSELITDSEAE